jgi:hypothetical protein
MRRKLGLVVLAVAVVSALAVVLTGRHGVTPAQAVSRAAKRSLDVGTARITISVEKRGSSSRGSGAFDYRARRGRLDLGRLAVIFDGGTTYVSLAVLGDARPVAVPAEKHWLRAPGSASGAVDPSRVFTFLRKRGAEVREAGHETVDGVRTTRYDGSVARKSDADELGGKRFSIWIDGDGLARRLRVSGAADGSEEIATIGFSDFGAPVHVEIPRPREVLTIAELQQLFAKQAAKETGCPNGKLCITEKVEGN